MSYLLTFLLKGYLINYKKSNLKPAIADHNSKFESQKGSLAEEGYPAYNKSIQMSEGTCLPYLDFLTKNFPILFASFITG